ncbi:hypothetical protein JTB14_004984 [Gonioctena quinquepunctata]|nr:hypothetical protein JTB14_004984 [Gonioctena quinquepunctata]
MTSEEKSVLEQTLGDLTEDTVAKDKYIEILKNDLKIFTEDALKAEKEMQELLDQQNVFLKIANEEIDKYKKSLDEINSITKSSAATQTCISAKKHTGIQVSPEVASKCIAVGFTNSTHLCNELDRFENRTSFNRKDIHPSSECTTIVNKPRLLLISGYHGKNISKFIHHQSQKFIVSSIVKTNAADSILVRTAIDNSVSYVKQDFVILWTSNPHPQLIDDFISKLNHTNPLILTQPYRRGTQVAPTPSQQHQQPILPRSQEQPQPSPSHNLAQHPVAPSEQVPPPKAENGDYIAESSSKIPEPTPAPVVRTPIHQRAVSLPVPPPSDKTRSQLPRPIAYSQSERIPNRERPPLNRSMSKKEIIKNYIRKETANFFGVDEENENQQQLRWLDRRKRMACR